VRFADNTFTGTVWFLLKSKYHNCLEFLYDEFYFCCILFSVIFDSMDKKAKGSTESTLPDWIEPIPVHF